jgi:hypothetical protein
VGAPLEGKHINVQPTIKNQVLTWSRDLTVTNGYQSVTSGELGPKGERLQGDLVYEPVSLVAAKALAKLVETPPVPPVGKEKKFYTDDDVKKWQKWWKKNKKQYGVE